MTEVYLDQMDIHKGNLILINKDYPLIDQDNRPPLVPLNHKFPELLLEVKAASVLSHLLTELSGSDVILPVSGYRSYYEQKEIYFSSLSELGLEFTEKYVAPPGHSEHQTGLAIDLAHLQEQIDFICPDFPYEGICNEFRNKAPDYGFVERYQSGKEKVTGIAPEPWHFRYVGFPHSRLMHEQNLSLEEYIDYLKDYPSTGQHLTISHCAHLFEIYYINLSAAVRTRIKLPENSLYQISGNNVDGIIITLWRKDNEL